jgi:hypothetical protein
VFFFDVPEDVFEDHDGIVILFRVKPMIRISVNVAMIEAGIATDAMTVLRQSRMKSKTVRATRMPARRR